MDVRLELKQSLVLTKDEWRLISKALRGALKPGPEQEEAFELQKKMHRLKHEWLKQTIAESQKVIDNIDKAETEDV